MRILIWIGLVYRGHDGKIVWPIKLPPRHVFSSWRSFIGYCRFWGPFYVFRNLPYVKSRTPGRLLPRRWGFGIFGFEFGDRGGT